MKKDDIFDEFAYFDETLVPKWWKKNLKELKNKKEIIISGGGRRWGTNWFRDQYIKKLTGRTE